MTPKYALLMTQTNNGFEQPFFCLVLVNKSLTIMIFEILNILYFKNKNYSDVSLKHFFFKSYNSVGFIFYFLYFVFKEGMICSCVGEIEIVEGT
jgi:hypothetical protein